MANLLVPFVCFFFSPWSYKRLPWWCSGKESTWPCRRPKSHGFDPWVGKIRWRRKWQPTPVFLPGESHGQRSLVGYSPWGWKESDMTEHACMHSHTCIIMNQELELVKCPGGSLVGTCLVHCCIPKAKNGACVIGVNY